MTEERPASAAAMADGPAAPVAFTAFETTGPSAALLERSPRRRDWMDDLGGGFANRCLPLLMANQAGWTVACIADATATWDGGVGLDALKVEGDGDWAGSHFGGGILTFRLPFLFRLPADQFLWMRGPANLPKDGIGPLEGLIETREMTATMNWMFTRPGTVHFARGEPIALVLPYPRDLLDRVRPEVVPLSADPGLELRHGAWAAGRNRFNERLKVHGTPEQVAGWQGDYFRGTLPDGSADPLHATKLRTCPFLARAAK